jgi:hypothetical protein
MPATQLRPRLFDLLSQMMPDWERREMTLERMLA